MILALQSTVLNSVNSFFTILKKIGPEWICPFFLVGSKSVLLINPSTSLSQRRASSFGRYLAETDY